MAVKKSELYSGLWASCDSLRGGMDSSQYKDYILTLLFVKYVSDKFKGDVYGEIKVPEGGSFDDMLALRGDKNIGEKMDKIIAKLAEANDLRGVIDNAHFNDENKLGKGEEMVVKLSELLAIFRDQMPDFSKNRADGDDIIGDAYEYLMRNFATESGKSKGQFYTPAEVSRILAKVVGIELAKTSDTTLYDPACGSGSLLIRAAETAPVMVSIYGQEKESITAGLARMNLVLHNMATAEIKGGYSTFSDPQYTNPDDDSVLRQFDFAVVNPPFSDKNWTHGLKDFGRFDGYAMPPKKNGDYAWLLHIIKSLKRKGKAAVIVPHGVLFRGNTEADIRRSLVDRGYIKGIIGLPANLFYGTGIPACIVVVDKENADQREGIFMIDASRDFIKDGNKNRLRERDVYKVATVFNQQTELPKYSRFVPNDEIKRKNEYNLNIPRYIDGSVAEDMQDIDGHLNGGIPVSDIDSLSKYWQTFPKLRSKLFKPLREGFLSLAVDKDAIRSTIGSDADFTAYSDKVESAFENWKRCVDGKLRAVSNQARPKELIMKIAEPMVKEYKSITLVDEYDAYEVLLSYWNETMADDIHVLVQDGYGVIREIEGADKTEKKKKNIEWDGKLIPKSLVAEMFFREEQQKINEGELFIEATQAELDDTMESADDESIIREVINDKGELKKTLLEDRINEIRLNIVTDEITALLGLLNSALPNKKEVEAIIRTNPIYRNVVTVKGTITPRSINDRIKEIRVAADTPDVEDLDILESLYEKQMNMDERSKLLKALKNELDRKIRLKYGELTDDQCLKLLLELKWYRSLVNKMFELYEKVSHNIADRIIELAERYEQTLPALESKTADLESKVKSHLKRMGFEW
jgi:type I restriction enzyme M protein